MFVIVQNLVRIIYLSEVYTPRGRLSSALLQKNSGGGILLGGKGATTVSQKIQKTNAMRMLDTLHIAYTPHEYDCGDGAIDGVSVARKTGQDPDRVFKTLVTQGASKAFYVFVIPVAAELDLKKAAKSVGEKSIAMLHVADLLKTTGYIRGGCSPVGMKKLFVTRVDETAELFDTILVSGGKQGLQVELAPADLLRAAQAETADLTF